MSEQSLERLISSLKTEAIEAAEKESEEILNDAKEKAQSILRQTEESKASIIEDAEQQAAAILRKGEAALRQAGRDYSISVRNALLEIFHAVFKEEIQKEFKPDLIKETISKVVENVGSGIEIKLSDENMGNLADFVHSRLQTAQSTASLLADDSVLNGFSITKTEEGWTYSISAEEVAEALNKYLNKSWVNIMNKGSES